ncbi:MAG TPA: diguanylate cyclase [Gaiellaceae bacterium]
MSPDAEERSEPEVIVRAVSALLGRYGGTEAVKLLHALTVRTPVGVFLSDAAGACRFVNAKWCELAGLTAAEASGDGWARALHPEDRARVAAEWDAAACEGRDSVITYRFLHPDGSTVWVEGHASAYRAEDGTLVGWIGACLDVTGYRISEHELVRERELFRVAFDAAPIGIALVDLEGRCFSANHALARHLGYGVEELRGLGIVDLTHPEDLESDLELATKLVAGEIRSYQLEKRYITKSRNVVWALLSVALVRDEQGAPLHFIAHVEDIAERKRAEEELRHLADRDSLTGLLNRRSFERDLERRVGQLDVSRTSLSLLLIDIDGFKQVNDTLGHHEGDATLAAVAAVLSARMRERDLIARLGGDEFAILTDTDNAARLALELLEGVRAEAIPTPAGNRSLTISIGIAAARDALESVDLLPAADAALYRAKQGGRNRYCHAADLDLRAIA